MLLDFYGELLTEKQRSFLEYFYNEDLTQSEIAQNEGITRQGVRDAINRAENALRDMESKLRLAARFTEMQEGLGEIIEAAARIREENLRGAMSRVINQEAAKIGAVAETLLK
jgi:predicted DNA-binding protein YlxM (UPF0122 family)